MLPPSSAASFCDLRFMGSYVKPQTWQDRNGKGCRPLPLLRAVKRLGGVQEPGQETRDEQPLWSSRCCPRCQRKTRHSIQPMNLQAGFPQIPYNQLSKSGAPFVARRRGRHLPFLRRARVAATTRFSNTCHLTTKRGLISSQFFGGSSFSIFNTSDATHGKKW